MTNYCDPESCIAYEKLGLICGGDCKECIVPSVIDKIEDEHLSSLNRTTD